VNRRPYGFSPNALTGVFSPNTLIRRLFTEPTIKQLVFSTLLVINPFGESP
jgi:hypothetical protein